ncbi:MAG: transposase [Ignavibacteriales bacterium]|nr:transposase [Ignavibacteriales bacterium]
MLEKGSRNKPLTLVQKKVNRLLSSIRNRVEKTFAFIKKVLDYERCSYYDLARNRLKQTTLFQRTYYYVYKNYYFKKTVILKN